ncbi:MYC proto-oncogene, bHLH transcription factor [Homo sapiens]|uniref:MYC proto-oncogene, bHLH transcription factor n=2 Tax=Homo sapiens TaxID=9606 RepID=Q14899_HUMAN|nr:ORF 114 [Homo sapiens]KAI2551286.1 MYC proto-oncogene, bHLH transcription factor [Homo sapiens]KAI4011931.1 MYC proto-oncogene, bHLH transcription factor [Homo sapiens]DAA06340.1 TPA_exp: myc-related translation/localization regulatory factor [Homo sapiens]
MRCWVILIILGIVFLLMPLSFLPIYTNIPRSERAPINTLLSSTLPGTLDQSAALSPALARRPAAWYARGVAVGAQCVLGVEGSCSACDDLYSQDKDAVCQTVLLRRSSRERERV